MIAEAEEVSQSCSPRSGRESPLNFAAISESGYDSSPPTPTSPQSISPPHTLKRSKSSSFRLLNRRMSTSSVCSQVSISPEPEEELVHFIGWYPALLVRLVTDLTGTFVYVFLKEIPLVLPTLWFSVCLWLFWKCVLLPLSIVKSVLRVAFVPPSERFRKKRTVLISGGSTLQALHLARNFYSAGARIVVCEVEGYFSLSKFSTAVHSYYAVPAPRDQTVDRYVDALKAIILKEKVTCYLPVSDTSSAYYDAVAKPYLEALGCECLCPDVKEVLLLDDTWELFKRIQCEGMATPSHYLVQNVDDLAKLYQMPSVRHESHFAVAVGLPGCKSKMKMALPKSKRKLRLSRPMSEHHPWLVVRDYPGKHYATCTFVRDSQIVANVTCKVGENGSLSPVEHPEILRWLEQFFASLKFHKKITGHVVFHFTEASECSGSLVPLDCKVGIGLSYLCCTNVHPRLVWKPCRHFSRNKSGPISAAGTKTWLQKTVLDALELPTVETASRLFRSIFGKSDALFEFWDPLPYCAYNYIQIPLRKIENSLKDSMM